MRGLKAVCVVGLLLAALSFGQFVKPNLATPVEPLAPEQSVTQDRARSALAKFGACVAPNAEVNVTLPVARAVVQKLAADGFEVRGLWCNETRSGAVVAQAVSEADLVAAGWPDTVALNLTVLGTKEHHSVAAIKKQMDYGWAYWWFAKRWVSFWW